MQSVTPRFLSALRNSHRVVVQVDAYLDGVLVGARLPITGGSVSVDRTSGVRRQLTVAIPDAAILPTLGAQLTPYGVELVVQRGIDYGDGLVEMVPLGTFRLDVGTTTSAQPTSYTGPDRAKALIDARFVGPRQADAVDAVTMITTLAVEVLPDVVVRNVDVTNPEDGTSVLPILPRVFWDRERWGAATDLAASLGAELYFDAVGELLVARTPAITNDPVWTVDQGAHGVLVDFTRELSREDTYNGVVASGERADGVYPARAVALDDDDPASPTRWGGPFGQVTYFYESSLIHTPNGAQRVADSLLADKVALSRSVRLSCVPNPALDVGDVIAVRMPNGVDERHLIDRLTIPLDPSQPMSIDTRTPSAVIVIDDPAPPLPPVTVGPPYVPPVLPPYVLPPPVTVPTYPPTPGGNTGPYTPGTPGPPYGPPTDGLYPGGVPVVPPTSNTDPFSKPTKHQDQFLLGAAAPLGSHWYVVYDGDAQQYDSVGLTPDQVIPVALDEVYDPLHRGVSGTLYYTAGPGTRPWGDTGAATALTRWLNAGGSPELIELPLTVQYDPGHSQFVSFGRFTDAPPQRPLTYQGTSIYISGTSTLLDVIPWVPDPHEHWIVNYDADHIICTSVGLKPGDSIPTTLSPAYDPLGRGFSGSLMYVTGASGKQRYKNFTTSGPDVNAYYAFAVHYNSIQNSGGGIGFDPNYGDILSYGNQTLSGPAQPGLVYQGTDITRDDTSDPGPAVVIDHVPIEQDDAGNGVGTVDRAGNYHFTLRHKPIEAAPAPVVWLNDERKLDADEYDLDLGTGLLTVFHTLAADPDDQIIVIYTANTGPIIVDPFPIEIQPVP